MIPLTVLAALMHACVPREPAWSEANTNATYNTKVKDLQQYMICQYFIHPYNNLSMLVA